MNAPRALKQPRVMSLAIATARRFIAVIYAGMIRRARSTKRKNAARLRSRFLAKL